MLGVVVEGVVVDGVVVEGVVGVVVDGVDGVVVEGVVLLKQRKQTRKDVNLKIIILNKTNINNNNIKKIKRSSHISNCKKRKEKSPFTLTLVLKIRPLNKTT